MFDIHSHILPKIDDGSESVESSTNSLRILKETGIEGVAFTPHFYPSRMEVDSFARNRKRAFERIKDSVNEIGIKTVLGSETYLSQALFNKEDLTELCYEGTNTILVEPEMEEKMTSSIDNKFNKFATEKSDLVPIIAHIERFPYIINDLKVMEYLKQMGYMFQINLTSLDGLFMKKKIFTAIENDYVQFVGSDIHKHPKSSKRYFHYIKELRNAFGEDIIEFFNKNTQKYILSEWHISAGERR